jgi:hypothetical protein
MRDETLAVHVDFDADLDRAPATVMRTGLSIAP